MKYTIDTDAEQLSAELLEATLHALRGQIASLPLHSRELSLTVTKLDEAGFWLRATFAAHEASERSNG